MTADKDKLSPDNAPKTMNMKKRAKRLNNKPLVIIFGVAGVIILILGWVIVGRGNKARGDVGKANVGGGLKPANAHARALTSQGEGGVVGEKPTPTPTVLPEKPAEPPLDKSPEKSTLPPPPLDKPAEKADGKPLGRNAKTELPRESEEVRKMRERRFKTLEAALDGPIRADMDDMMKMRHEAGKTEIERIDQQIAALNNSSHSSYSERLASMQLGVEGGSGGGSSTSSANVAATTQSATAANVREWRNPASVEAPDTPFMIRAGGVIPATLQTAINSDLEGYITGVVAANIYDSPTGNHVLIPQGSKLFGEYNSKISYGQSRLLVAWNRIEFPDGKVLDIGSMPGTSGAGQSGFRDRVNHHFMRIFGSAIMMSAIIAGVEMSQDDSSSSSEKARMSDALSEALGQQLGGVMSEMLQKNMNIAPTIEIREGYQFNVMLARDLVFPGPYRGFDYVRR